MAPWNGPKEYMTTANVLVQPLYSSTAISRHHQLRTGGRFTAPPTRLCWQLVHSDYAEDTRVGGLAQWWNRLLHEHQRSYSTLSQVSTGMGDLFFGRLQSRYVAKPTKSTQPCILWGH